MGKNYRLQYKEMEKMNLKEKARKFNEEFEDIIKLPMGLREKAEHMGKFAEKLERRKR
jgi:hypothetical protein